MGTINIADKILYEAITSFPAIFTFEAARALSVKNYFTFCLSFSLSTSNIIDMGKFIINPGPKNNK